MNRLLLIGLALAACSDPDVRNVPAQAEGQDTMATADEPRRAATDSPAAAPAETTAHRSPETDPMMFEGIPNFEDVEALREGDWLLVAGSFEGNPSAGDRPGPDRLATITRATDPDVAAIQQKLWDQGRVPWVVVSERIPLFEPGRIVVVLGPFPRPDAERLLADLRRVVPDARIERGWGEVEVRGRAAQSRARPATHHATTNTAIPATIAQPPIFWSRQ